MTVVFSEILTHIMVTSRYQVIQRKTEVPCKRVYFGMRGDVILSEEAGIGTAAANLYAYVF